MKVAVIDANSHDYTLVIEKDGEEVVKGEFREFGSIALMIAVNRVPVGSVLVDTGFKSDEMMAHCEEWGYKPYKGVTRSQSTLGEVFLVGNWPDEFDKRRASYFEHYHVIREYLKLMGEEE